jgi:tRNA pseudouridine65 synthase
VTEEQHGELRILYQDPWLVAIDKPAGMLVHPGREPEPTSQIAMKVLRDQIGKRVSTLHRLDRPTSGVLLFALDPIVEKDLRRQFADQSIEKKYIAVVIGESPERWTNHSPLQKEEGEPYREAQTDLFRQRTVRIGDDPFSILTARPKTGRYHQIRKHLASDGFPIVGDYLYGKVEEMEKLAQRIGQSRLMLHASELQFHHPVENAEMTIACPLPQRFAPFSGQSVDEIRKSRE